MKRQVEFGCFESDVLVGLKRRFSSPEQLSKCSAGLCWQRVRVKCVTKGANVKIKTPVGAHKIETFERLGRVGPCVALLHRWQQRQLVQSERNRTQQNCASELVL
jgi:hypothetical protein